jgi:hypothetical protein
MGTVSRRPKFDPTDLELIDRVYAVACAYIEARDLYRDLKHDLEEEDALRRLIFTAAGDGRLDFDTLCDRVLAAMDKYRILFRAAANQTSVNEDRLTARPLQS